MKKGKVVSRDAKGRKKEGRKIAKKLGGKIKYRILYISGLKTFINCTYL